MTAPADRQRAEQIGEHILDAELLAMNTDILTGPEKDLLLAIRARLNYRLGASQLGDGRHTGLITLAAAQIAKEAGR